MFSGGLKTCGAPVPKVAVAWAWSRVMVLFPAETWVAKERDIRVSSRGRTLMTVSMASCPGSRTRNLLNRASVICPGTAGALKKEWCSTNPARIFSNSTAGNTTRPPKRWSMKWGYTEMVKGIRLMELSISGPVRWLYKFTAEVAALFIPHHPYGQISIHVIQPGFERFRICGMPEKPCRDNGTTRGIMAAVGAVRIRNTACGISVPGLIGPVLPECFAQANILMGIHSRVGALKQIVQTLFMGV